MVDLLPSRPHAFRIALFRTPQAHVISQYTECREATWALATTRSWEQCSLPSCLSNDTSPPTRSRFPRSGTWQHDFANWLDAFARNPLHHGFGCYSPWNMQSRAMTCCARSPKCANHNSHLVTAEPEPEASLAIARMQQLEAVGLTEHFRLSICLIVHRMGKPLPASCLCGSNASVLEERKNVRASREDGEHGTLTLAVEKQIDAFTVVDRQFYAAARSRFVRDVRQMERDLGKPLQYVHGHEFRCI